MNSLTPPRLTALSNQKAERVRENAIYYFLIESGDFIQEEWGHYAQELFQEFATTLPVVANWWIERRFAAGMPNRPGRAISAIKETWERFNQEKKEQLAEEIINISESNYGAVE